MEWKRLSKFMIGGTTNLGFTANSNCLLVVTHSGRALVEIKTGALLDRDCDESFEWHRDTEADGIGKYAGTVIPVFGIHAELPKEVKFELSNFDLDSHITEFKGAALSSCRSYLAIGYSDEVRIYVQA